MPTERALLFARLRPPGPLPWPNSISSAEPCQRYGDTTVIRTQDAGLVQPQLPKPHAPIGVTRVLTAGTNDAMGSEIVDQIGPDGTLIQDVDTTLFLRRGKQLQLSMGDSGYWEDVLAEELLDR